ncbi:hypothetical protein [Polaromonas sp. JS666]|uniref:hypothetical protein n=1 Tax=Polaromonas sp. (strain JS666 / ATCC BAA-500) TaxID=296591 RepID=UPI0012EE097A|nr:hypothetical protein [Polaromonas sp. JS666]
MTTRLRAGLPTHIGEIFRLAPSNPYVTRIGSIYVQVAAQRIGKKLPTPSKNLVKNTRKFGSSLVPWSIFFIAKNMHLVPSDIFRQAFVFYEKFSAPQFDGRNWSIDVAMLLRLFGCRASK